MDVDPDFSDIVVYNCSSFFHRFSIVVKLTILFDCAIYIMTMLLGNAAHNTIVVFVIIVTIN